MSALARPLPSSCRSFSPALGPYLDNELEPSQVVALETHLAGCPSCREQVAFDRAVRVSLQRMPKPGPSEALRARVALSLQRERSLARPLRAAPTSFARVAAPLAVAAGFALLLAVRTTWHQSETSHSMVASTDPAHSSESSSVSLGIDGVVNELVSLHAQPLFPEFTQPDDVHKFDPFVGVRVDPPQLGSFGARFSGARIVPLGSERMAVLQYALQNGHRVTWYVFNSQRVDRRSDQLREQQVRGVPVLVGKVRGYTVATASQKGVGYAVAWDLNEPESVQLAVAGSL